MTNSILSWLFGGFNLNIEQQLAFYGAYHSNPWNQLIHVVFVPIIWTTALIWLAHSPKLFPGAPYWCNLSFLAYVAYASFYLLLDFQTAIIVDTVYLALFFYANKLVHDERERESKAKSGASSKPSGKRSYTIAKVALVLHIFGWYMQIHPGHAVLEGRKPALLDSFVQSLVLAPLFVFYEAIWFLVPGYQPELHARVDELIRAQQLKMGM